MSTDHPLEYTLIASIVFIAVVLATIAVARVVERRNRRLIRQRLQTLNASWRDHARNGGGARLVRRQARAADETLFWTALETLTLALNRSGWRRLSDDLGSSRHPTGKMPVLLFRPALSAAEQSPRGFTAPPARPRDNSGADRSR